MSDELADPRQMPHHAASLPLGFSPPLGRSTLHDLARLSRSLVNDRAFRPLCDRCGRPVERVMMAATDDPSLGIRFTAYCHGAQEECFMALDDIRQATAVQAPVCFRDGTLPKAPETKLLCPK